MDKNSSLTCDFPAHMAMTESELLEAQLRYESTREGLDNPVGCCDLPDHEAMSAEEVIEAQREADGRRIPGQAASREPHRMRAAERRGRPRTPSRSGPVARTTGKKPDARKKDGRPVGASDNRPVARRRGIRLGRHMPAPEILEGVPLKVPDRGSR